ncbi:MAG: HAD family hydrolase [Sphaerochaeta sp.]|jgi:Cof subfamily protein (haloacid dehalogenase superfamily)|nr:HAD family hydrolase [Sphaerochaeta sp.]MDX9915835.1 HAD family hydrolase [Sphaerochaeta sp.]
MHDYTLICCDIDGTLLGPNHTISVRAKRAISDVVQSGITFALVSGRNAQSVASIQKELSLTGAMGCFNGALSLDEQNRVIDERPIDYQVARSALGELAHSELEFFLYTNQHWYVQSRNCWHDAEVSYSGIAGTIEPLCQLERHLDGSEKPFKLLAMHRDPSYITEMTGTLQHHFQGTLDIFNYHPNYIELLPTHTDKGRSVRAFKAYYHIERDRVIAIGDYYNDIAMFQAAGMAVAMGNAPADVQAHAHHITLSNSEDGLARFLESLV